MRNSLFCAQEIYIIFSVILNVGNAEERRLLLSNDGPSILGASITFFAVLEYFDPQEEFYFEFVDEGESNIIKGPGNISFTKPFPETVYKESTYKMKVTVKKTFLLWNITVGNNYTDFSLSEYMIGNITVLQNNSDKCVESTEDAEDVAVGENITLVVQLHDPSGYFKHSKIAYMWSIDQKRISSNGNLTYNYTHPGISNVVVLAAAYLPSGALKWGFFNKQLNVKVPVNFVNVSGNPFLHRGEILNLQISCNGTSPFEYCWEEVNETGKNFSCSSGFTVTTTCSFTIYWYFPNYGTHHIGILISNDVKTVRRNIEVVIYNVSTTPQLSTVIIPVVCSILTLIIIISGIAYYIQSKNQLAVEVANFDFQESDEYIQRTFFERIFGSFRCRIFTSGSSCEEDSDLLENEHS